LALGPVDDDVRFSQTLANICRRGPLKAQESGYAAVNGEIIQNRRRGSRSCLKVLDESEHGVDGGTSVPLGALSGDDTRRPSIVERVVMGLTDTYRRERQKEERDTHRQGTRAESIGI
jgi:hypothetical protein